MGLRCRDHSTPVMRLRRFLLAAVAAISIANSVDGTFSYDGKFEGHRSCFMRAQWQHLAPDCSTGVDYKAFPDCTGFWQCAPSGQPECHSCPGVLLFDERLKVCNYDPAWSCHQDAYCEEPADVDHADVSWDCLKEECVSTYKCHPGYVMNGSSYRSCHADGSWSSVEFVCKAYCGEPVYLDNSEVYVDCREEGCTATYTCTGGLQMADIICGSTGEWSPLELECNAYCGEPAHIDNADVYVDCREEGCIAIYTCTGGVQMADIICESTGEWSLLELECNAYCGEPVHLDNAEVYVDCREEGCIAIYTCTEGLQVSDIICGSTGEWSPLELECNAYCGEPVHIDNADVYVDCREEGCTAIYTCTGELQMADILCGSTGEWSPLELECNAYCGEPVYLDNAEVYVDCREEGCIAIYTCTGGLQMADIICESTGEWSLLKLECNAYCGEPVYHDNADVYVDCREEGCIAMYTCTGGLQMADIICGSTGEWSPLELECNAYCGEPAHIDNADVYVHCREEGCTATYTCTGGLQIADIICESTGEWSPLELVCNAYCGEPAYLDNADVHVDCREEGCTATYTCTGGLQMADIICGSTGEWSLLELECNAYCGEPAHIDNADVYVDCREEGCTATYTCTGGLQMADIICGSAGEWSPFELECNGETGPASENDIVSSVELCTEDGCKTVHTCGDGTTVTCQWHIDQLSMTYSCATDKGEENDNGQDSSEWDEVVPPMAVEEVCGNDGCVTKYTCGGGRVVTCQWEEQDSRLVFSCKVHECGAPILKADAQVCYSEKTVGSQATYSCHDGYTLAGSPVVTCLENGHWTPATFSCHESHCPEPEQRANAEVHFDTLSIGSWAEYSCNSGFMAIGQPFITCQLNFEWDDLDFRCERMSIPLLLKFSYHKGHSCGPFQMHTNGSHLSSRGACVL
ncbi:hypothetical protein ScPMuIL_002940 [Solemya velum]